MVEVSRLHELFRLEGDKLIRVANQGKAKAGQRAGGAYGSLGYRRVRVDMVYYSEHRVIWAMHHGQWPTGSIDHVDGDPSNNDPSNLRLCTQGQNMCNTRLRDDNTTGVKGLDLHKGKWRGRVQLGGKVRTKVSKDRHSVIEWINRTRGEVHGEFARQG